MDRRIAGTHFAKDLFSGNAAVHEPDPIGLAVLALNFFKKVSERGFVGGVAAEHFVSQRQTFRSDDQRYDDLHAVGAFITAVTAERADRFQNRCSSDRK